MFDIVNPVLIVSGLTAHLLTKMIDFYQNNPEKGLKDFFSKTTFLSIVLSLVSLVPITLILPEITETSKLMYFTVGFANSALLRTLSSIAETKMNKNAA